MLKFPAIFPDTEPPLPKMTLREYARFSESCLLSNPAITPENCLHKRIDEATMHPFRLPPQDRSPK